MLGVFDVDITETVVVDEEGVDGVVEVEDVSTFVVEENDVVDEVVDIEEVVDVEVEVEEVVEVVVGDLQGGHPAFVAQGQFPRRTSDGGGGVGQLLLGRGSTEVQSLGKISDVDVDWTDGRGDVLNSGNFR